MPQVDTLRACLLQLRGLDAALTAQGAKNLDRPLAQIDADLSGDSLVVAYYLRDELRADTGPLHVSLFERQSARWVDAPDLAAEYAGSIMGIERQGPHVLVRLHWTPSAGAILVLDARTMRRRALLERFHPTVLPLGDVFFSGNMVHFAPYHQETAWMFDARSDAVIEIFPGESGAPVGTGYQQTLDREYAKVPETERLRFAEDYPAYGDIHAFDRSVHHPPRVSADGLRLAFFGTYGPGRFPPSPGADSWEHPELPTAVSVVACQRAVERWGCTERELGEAARALGVAIDLNSSEPLSEASIDQLLTAAMAAR